MPQLDTAFPASQSIGRLCPIFKGGDEHDLGNYRGITVGTVLSKLYATVLERRSLPGRRHQWLG